MNIPLLSNKGTLRVLILSIAGMALILSIKITSYKNEIYTQPSRHTRVITMKEILAMMTMYRMFVYLGVILICWGINMHIWKKYKINYSYLLDFDKNVITSFKTMSAGLTIILMTGIFIYLSLLSLSPPIGLEFFNLIPYWIYPLLLTITVGFYSIYRLKNKWLVNTFMRVIRAPMKKVYFKDNWFGDQLTSICPLFSDIFFEIGYYIFAFSNLFSDVKEIGSGFLYYRIFFVPLICCVPYAFRLLQCLRQARDNKDRTQLFNAGKYFFSILNILAAGMKMYKRSITIPLWIIVGLMSSTYSTIWDIFMDWEIGRKEFDLIRKVKKYPENYYYIGILEDIIFRFFWLINIVRIGLFSKNFVMYKSIGIIIGVVEIIRRGYWNIIRVEQEEITSTNRNEELGEIPMENNYTI